VPQRFIGEGTIKAIELRSTVNDELFELSIHGVFEYVGLLPNTSFIDIPELARDEMGFVLTDAEMCTNISGLFAAGDVRAKAFRQVSTAVGDGATAQYAAERIY
jgi:thioredoxin reductase (NADPH)